MSKEDRIEYLDDERKKLWKELRELQSELTEVRSIAEKKVSEHEAVAYQASRKCSEYKNRCEKALQAAIVGSEKINGSIQLIETLQSEAELQSDEVAKRVNSLNELLTRTEKYSEQIVAQRENLDYLVTELEVVFENREKFSEKFANVEVWYKEIVDFIAKSKASYNQILARKSEIDTLYYEIIGVPSSEEDSDRAGMPGLKAELEASYKELKGSFIEFEAATKNEFSSILNSWKAEYTASSTKIKELLPNALTAGLSYAYSQKRESEINDSNKLSKIFIFAIVALVVISLIPFSVNLYLISTGLSLDEAILRMPRLVLAILPLYIPVLWVAYSTNKKINLSKRLIEEYTHKEVLSKTFEGLSQQISNMQDSQVSSELKTKLLYNILDVSSENPGKLISNYDKSDHPLMDALDKSVQLTNAVEKLIRIPGMGKIAHYLDKKSEAVLSRESQKADDAIESIQTKPTA